MGFAGRGGGSLVAQTRRRPSSRAATAIGTTTQAASAAATTGIESPAAAGTLPKPPAATSTCESASTRKQSTGLSRTAAATARRPSVAAVDDLAEAADCDASPAVGPEIDHLALARLCSQAGWCQYSRAEPPPLVRAADA